MYHPLTREHLFEIIKDMRERDPLLRNGVQPDWVCVINPAIVSTVKEIAKQYKSPDSPRPVSFNELDQILGRRTFVIEDAPRNIEYMPMDVMKSRYADYFRRVDEWLKTIAENSPDDSL